MQFSEKLKELRAQKGVSQSELAEKIYVSRSAVAKWENGWGLPSNESLGLLSEYFGVSKEELYSDEPTENVIVQKNKVISHSRKLIIIISTVCAVALTAIIVLSLVFGLKSSAPAKPVTPNRDVKEFTPTKIKGTLYGGAQYDHDEGCWTTPHEEWKRRGYRDLAASGEQLYWEKYTFTTGDELAMIVRFDPYRIDVIRDYWINAACVGLKYNSDVFDIVRAGAEDECEHGEYNPIYLITVKKPCQNEEIVLYIVMPGMEITKDSKPSSKLIITVLPS
ncbi:MAG: helix-turn-helix transcriptional regulator [Clostridiales bacterium]|nr:helix-turn-helix transcriptional regulator [Clostridiales bacterium]